MTLVARLFLFLLLTFIPFILLAQTVVNSVNGIKWSLIPTWRAAAFMGTSAYNSSGSALNEGILTGIIKIDDNSIISNVQLDANNYGVVRLNKDLSTQWLTYISGYPIAIGVLNGKILVISAKSNSSFNGISNHYIGYIIDEKSGQLSTQKDIYDGSDQFYEQPVFLYAPDGSFFKMIVRTSNFTRGSHNPLLMFKMNKVADAYFTTTDFKLFEFDDKLNIKNTTKPVLEQGYFLGATTNANGDVFLMTDYEQGIIKIAKYENGKTTPVKVLKQEVSMSDDVMNNLYDNYILTSKTDPTVIYYICTYFNSNKDTELIFSKFNFKDGTVVHNTQVMNKAYFKDLAKSYVPFSKKFDDVNMGSSNKMRIRNIIESDEKLIVGLSSSLSVTYYDGKTPSNKLSAFDLLINIYDSKANLQYQQIIPRSFSSYSDASVGIGMHCSNNTLFIVANSNKGLADYKALYSQIDLKNGTITKITGIEKNDIKNSYEIDPYGSIWFDKQFVLSYMEKKGFTNSSKDAHMQLLNY